MTAAEVVMVEAATAVVAAAAAEEAAAVVAVAVVCDCRVAMAGGQRRRCGVQYVLAGRFKWFEISFESMNEKENFLN